MIAELEQAIVNRITSKWAEYGTGRITSFDIARDFEDITSTISISIATEWIQVSNPADDQMELQPNVAVYSVIKDVGDSDRRHIAAVAMVELICRLLNGQEFSGEGLEIDPLRAFDSKEIAHTKLKEISAVCFRTVFKTAFNLNSIDDQETIQMVSEQISYFIDGTETANATDLVEFSEG